MVRKKIEIENVEDLISWVKAGKQRREIIQHLRGKQTPTEVAEASSYSLNHSSRILILFKKQEIVKLLNPNKKTGRLYELTEKGNVVKDSLTK
jgi:hypothetical protein